MWQMSFVCSNHIRPSVLDCKHSCVLIMHLSRILFQNVFDNTLQTTSLKVTELTSSIISDFPIGLSSEVFFLELRSLWY